MTTLFFQRLFTRYPIKTRRALEILPGLTSWLLILSPLWGSFLFPTVLAYFILFFDVYWFYKSFSLVYNTYRSTRKIALAEKVDWMGELKTLKQVKKVHHVIVIPNYKEQIYKLRETLTALASQTFPAKQIHIVLAMEEREENAREKADTLIREFKSKFGSIFASYHPDVIGEVKGKSSNEAYGGRVAYQKLFEEGSLDLDFATVTSADADSIFDKQYYAYLTYKFLTDTNRYHKFWQSAVVFYNNIWKVPAPTRIISFFGSLYRTSLLVQGDRLITQSTYSLSFKLLKEVDFWDVDVIPEDYRIFFKAFYHYKGQVWVEPMYIKTSMDAAFSPGYINSLKNKYHQERRWSWGVSDDPVFIKWYLTVPGVPFIQKTMRLYFVLLDHFLWPVNWFIITVAANIMPFVNPVFSRTNLGYRLPQLAGVILTSCLLAILCMIYLDYKQRAKHVKLPIMKQLMFPLEFILMPVVGFFLSALPALISHTQLMFGKRLEYKVTEKL
ncbi:MAG: glycosyltransferase family 2 protein [Candidatus Levybacteria bacterium]|nr:glycosyltransferase family 2 protein [Candidatus Levybacteria bacterium]